MAFIYDLTDTWNAGGTTFNAIKMNVTDSASAAASKLVTLQVGGSERFGVRKDGQGYFAGNVGIGTSSPGYKLDVTSAGTSALRISGPANVLSDLTDGTITLRQQIGGEAAFGTVGAHPLALRTNNTERMRIDGSGRFGVGTTSPTATIHSKNDGSLPTLTLETSAATGSNFATFRDAAAIKAYFGFTSASTENFELTNSENGAMVFATNNAERMRIDSSGNLLLNTAFAAYSAANRGNITVFGAASAIYAFNVAGAESGYLFADTTGVEVGAAATKTIRFNIAGERMRITDVGNVGIGTSSPARRLTVSAGAGSSVLAIQDANTGSAATDGFQLQLASNGDMYLWNYENAITAFGTNNTERMRIDSSGRVGVGTSAPGKTLDLVGQFRASGAAGSGYALLEYGTSSTATNNWHVGSEGDGSFRWYNGSFGAGTERMRIDSSGNLLVGTTSTSASNTGDGAVFNGVNGSLVSRRTTGANQSHIAFVNNGVLVGSINTSTTATTYNTSSDARLKENIAPADDAAALIDAIQVRKFDWKADGSHQRYGMVAQELLEVAPEAVSVPADEDHMMGVDYSKLVPMLVKAIQELTARVAQLEGN